MGNTILKAHESKCRNYIKQLEEYSCYSGNAKESTKGGPFLSCKLQLAPNNCIY